MSRPVRVPSIACNTSRPMYPLSELPQSIRSYWASHSLGVAVRAGRIPPSPGLARVRGGGGGGGLHPTRPAPGHAHIPNGLRLSGVELREQRCNVRLRRRSNLAERTNRSALAIGSVPTLIDPRGARRRVV